MFKPVPVAIGLRYLRAKRRNGFISFVSLASILGIAIGVMVLITTLAVMSGFQREIKDRMLGMVAHATVSAHGEAMAGWAHAVEVARRDPRVVGAAPYIDAQALLRGPRQEPAAIRGVLPEAEAAVSELAAWMVQGSLDDLRPGEFNIVLGKELAQWLGVRVGDRIVVTTDFQVTPMGAMPQLKRFTVSGIFEAGYQDFDRRLAVVHMADAQRVMRMGEGVTGVRLKLHDMDRAWEVARDLAVALEREGNGYFMVSDWSMENANMFRALKLEKTMIGILLSLIILMGAFSLLNSQVMLVTDKLADIAILRTLGLTPRGVMGVFMVQGTLIGVIGTVLGVVGGLLLTFNLEHILRAIEAAFEVVLMPEDVYYVTGLPIDLQVNDVVVIAVVALLMAFLATIYPAWRAARTAPAEALRYE
ncbi:lipoprotein-releasing ABC transporter permease subunit [Luteimonas wenzhouensis]|jgi:lipoprotein-releasing system permease protein|uniref:Lipoprotein-releasing ABC transporter permease subunit n=1 Tax=Luteimonas wenzhouensis TaxID=2599615 RepID=A0A5C5U607_9GAMM|nr:lipoprotein-releasing ABC transporter permease subunit [Luteimonas wenzhouensis]NLW97778.1 lipoprotein-releasing ABC transporter permease subunit [Xanthomonadaceae bacterium]TWT21773.1 lipoprotein-releasing ABC transporter permease subunit [Luteimonas wenzhouensis]